MQKWEYLTIQVNSGSNPEETTKETLGMFGGDRGSVLAREVECWFEQARSTAPLSASLLETLLIQLHQEIDRLNNTPMATTLLMAHGSPKPISAEGEATAEGEAKGAPPLQAGVDGGKVTQFGFVGLA